MFKYEKGTKWIDMLETLEAAGNLDFEECGEGVQ